MRHPGTTRHRSTPPQRPSTAASGSNGAPSPAGPRPRRTLAGDNAVRLGTLGLLVCLGLPFACAESFEKKDASRDASVALDGGPTHPDGSYQHTDGFYGDGMYYPDGYYQADGYDGYYGDGVDGSIWYDDDAGYPVDDEDAGN